MFRVVLHCSNSAVAEPFEMDAVCPMRPIDIFNLKPTQGRVFERNRMSEERFWKNGSSIDSHTIELGRVQELCGVGPQLPVYRSRSKLHLASKNRPFEYRISGNL